MDETEPERKCRSGLTDTTKKVLDLLEKASEKRLPIQSLYSVLGISRRRLRDIVNALEPVGLVKETYDGYIELVECESCPESEQEEMPELFSLLKETEREYATEELNSLLLEDRECEKVLTELRKEFSAYLSDSKKANCLCVSFKESCDAFQDKSCDFFMAAFPVGSTVDVVDGDETHGLALGSDVYPIEFYYQQLENNRF
ncbi:MAG: uncharacterized protein A8A55_0630 [Amphiamblys sp. WSBS2006]|nr:MAG: uncharacterized protein A8A55_0630 [Amphiamblys sp. WSBS2006]